MYGYFSTAEQTDGYMPDGCIIAVVRESLPKRRQRERDPETICPRTPSDLRRYPALRLRAATG